MNKKPKRLMRGLLLAVSLLSFVPSASAAPPPPTGMRAIIEPLFEQRLTSLMKQYHRGLSAPLNPIFVATSKTAVREAAIDFRTYLESEANRQKLLEAPQNEGPLLMAASFGFAEFVEALLAYPEFRAGLNAPIEHYGSLWASVSTIPLQNWMVCGDGHMMGMMAPMMGYLGFQSDASPYKKIRRLLEEAGATPRPDQARANWLRICDLSQFDGYYGPQESSPGVRERVADAPDIQQAILDELEALAKARGWIAP
jgi:hypothetical protein